MANCGWVTVSCEYRMCPDALFPDLLIDCKRVMRWIKLNIERALVRLGGVACLFACLVGELQIPTSMEGTQPQKWVDCRA